MEKIAKDFKDADVVFYMLYTREPHPGQKMGPGGRGGKAAADWNFDFSDKKQTKTHEERVDYALEMMKEYSEERSILVDTFGEKCLQKTLGGGRPNSLIVIDKEGKVALWQSWSSPNGLRKKLDEMTGKKTMPENPIPENQMGMPLKEKPKPKADAPKDVKAEPKALE
ncbi:hypothetical protein ACFL1X_11370 [Candidatus Hydrogenedentota bacterium]